jgi:hypothetical protein
MATITMRDDGGFRIDVDAEEAAALAHAIAFCVEDDSDDPVLLDQALHAAAKRFYSQTRVLREAHSNIQRRCDVCDEFIVPGEDDAHDRGSCPEMFDVDEAVTLLGGWDDPEHDADVEAVVVEDRRHEVRIAVPGIGVVTVSRIRLDRP